MKQSVNSYDFHRAFEQLRPDNFSYDGLEALFEYFEQLEDDIGEEIELDVIAICCDYSEMTLEEINQDYMREYETIDEAIEDLSDETTVIPVITDSEDENENTVIVQAF